MPVRIRPAMRRRDVLQSGAIAAGCLAAPAIEAVFVRAPEPGQVNLPPSAGMQFFGQVDIEGATDVMTVRLKDMTGMTLFSQELVPEI